MVALTWGNALVGDNAAIYGSIQTLAVYSDPVLDIQWLYSGAQAQGTVTRTRLIEGADMANPASFHVTGTSGTYRVSDMEIVDTGSSVRVLTTAVEDARVSFVGIGDEGRLSGQISRTIDAPASQLHGFEVDGTSFIAAGARDAQGLVIYEQSGTNLIQRDALTDHAKTALGDVADLAHVKNDAGTFLITGSTTEGGISSYLIGADGQAHLVDTLGAKDGMWLSGLDSVTSVQAGGVDYVAVGAVGSSSLSLVRVNDMGVLFVEDHAYDTLNSRFARVDAVTSFEVGDRGFLVAGGADDGLSLLEILPDRTLFQHDTLANQAGGALENITALTVADFGGEVQVIAAGQPGLTLARVDTSAIAGSVIGAASGEALTGGAQNDLIWGNGGNDTLSGGDGDDVLSGGDGRDILTGGAGADTFIFDRDFMRDEVRDFELGVDRLDVSDWGRIYDASSLTVQERYDGAILQYQDQSLRLISHDGQRINAEDITNDMFLF
ncbi:calcium-binding protein [Pseudooceanicola sp. MF1-13]|uniref:calcium-binding protein n=1 Tax=Pseudooceanicola sp. MF1-13 TaxID=3379095 RepID=UPI003891D97B